jgi:hypothetical protein
MSTSGEPDIEADTANGPVLNPALRQAPDLILANPVE